MAMAIPTLQINATTEAINVFIMLEILTPTLHPTNRKRFGLLADAVNALKAGGIWASYVQTTSDQEAWEDSGSPEKE
jgi:hypothetical protein